MKYLVKQTVDEIKRIENMGPEYGIQVSAIQLQMAGFSPGGFVRELFQHIDTPVTVTEPPQTGNLIIKVDHETMAREATKQ